MSEKQHYRNNIFKSETESHSDPPFISYNFLNYRLRQMAYDLGTVGQRYAEPGTRFFLWCAIVICILKKVVAHCSIAILSKI